MVFASDKIHHVAQRELALSEAKPGDWILQSEIGQFPHGLLAGMWSAGHQQQRQLLLFFILHEWVGRKVGSPM
jgi:hypothetical protein